MQCDIDARCRDNLDKDEAQVLYREYGCVVIGVRIPESNKKLTAPFSKPGTIGGHKHAAAGTSCHTLVKHVPGPLAHGPVRAGIPRLI